MSDTRNHTTRDQLVDLLRENMSRGTSGRWIATYGITPEDFADTILASDAIAAVRAAAVAETTAAIEAVLNPEGHPNGRDYGRAAVWSDDVRAALSGGRTAHDTTLAQAWDEGWEAAWSPMSMHNRDNGPNPYRADTGANQ